MKSNEENVKDFSEFFSSRRGKKIDKNCDQFISINQIYFNRIIFASFSDRTDYFSIKKRFNKKQHLHSSIPIGVQIRVRIWRRANIIAITPLITVCSCQGNQAATRSLAKFALGNVHTWFFSLLFPLCEKKKNQNEPGPRFERFSMRREINLVGTRIRFVLINLTNPREGYHSGN